VFQADLAERKDKAPLILFQDFEGVEQKPADQKDEDQKTESISLHDVPP
jgi:hypothetical protein